VRVAPTRVRSWAVPRALVASRTQRLDLRRPRAASEEDVEPADMAQLVRTPVLGRGAGTFDATASLAEDIERCARVLSDDDTDATSLCADAPPAGPAVCAPRRPSSRARLAA